MADTEDLRAALGSWRDTATRDAIVEFLHSVTRGPDAVPRSQRLAAFDNDGTLTTEKPQPALGAFLDSLTGGERHRAATAQQRVEALVPGLPDPDTEELVASLFDGTTAQHYVAQAARFLRTSRHPRFGRPWPELLYAPMLELMALLADLEFTVYVVSGSSRDFLRAMAESYALTPEHVIGTEVEMHFREGRLVRTAKLATEDRGSGKPAHFWDRSGGMPLLVAGNSLTDHELLSCARFRLLVDHDDAAREYAYTDEQALSMARSNGWTVVSMRDDFATVFRGS